MEEFNPWWIKEEDPKYREYLKAEYKHYPEEIKKIKIGEFGLYFLTGPRQVGKTTALKIFLHDVLKKESPYSIFYYSCEDILNYKELEEVLRNYFRFVEEKGTKPKIIALDEITYVKEWHRTIKKFIDLGKFNGISVVLTGSTSFEILKEKERFPGRRGAGRDIVLLPLQFSDYIKFFLKIERKKFDIDEFYYSNLVFKERIREIFLKYLETGGFLYALNKRENIYETYVDWIKGDLKKDGKNEETFKEIVKVIAESNGSPLSYNSIAKETSVSSPHTIQSYLEFMENIYLINILQFIGLDKKIYSRKNKKVHFNDPLIAKVLSKYVNIEVFIPYVVESSLSSHIKRSYPVYYYSGKTEVDVVAKIKDKLYGFESKWGFKQWRRPRGIKSILLDKDKLPVFLASYKF